MKCLLATLLVFLIAFVSSAQPPFENEIRQFQKSDSIEMPPSNAILFVGSSSFRLWEDVQRAFPGFLIINRGFGGSSLADVIRYKEQIIFPYLPRQIVIYCGENDIASGVPPIEVLTRFDELFTSIRAVMPRVPIAFVSMKPSPSREKFREELQTGNRLIREYLRAKPRTNFIDVFTPMLNEKGKPRPEIFVSDSLHMNDKGYAIWQRRIRPFLRR